MVDEVLNSQGCWVNREGGNNSITKQQHAGITEIKISGEPMCKNLEVVLNYKANIVSNKQVIYYLLT